MQDSHLDEMDLERNQTERTFQPDHPKHFLGVQTMLRAPFIKMFSIIDEENMNT